MIGRWAHAVTQAVTPVLAFGGLLMGAWIGAPSWLDIPKPMASAAPKLVANDPVVGYLDMRDGRPTLFASAGGVLEVSGWAACSAPGSALSSVTVLIDGQSRGDVKSFYKRPDVAAAYGRPEFALSGWSATVGIAGMKAGDYKITARGLCSHGEQGLLPDFRLTILE
jgi:hypothetical protein